MDAFLDNNGSIIFMQPEPESPFTEFDEEEKVSMWVIDNDIIRPSTNVSTQTKLYPGIYTVDFHRDYGMFCKKVNIDSDELIIFSNSIISDLINEINLFWDKKDIYKNNKLIHKRGILLEGYPGTGKTSIISLLSEEVIKRKGIVFKVSGPKNLSIYIDFIRNSFRIIEPETPIISIIEDLDKYEGDDSLLDFLDGKSNVNHHVVITTTNNTKDLSDAFLRPSRIDLRIEVPLPCEQTRREYFTRKGVSEEFIENLVSKSENLSLADLKEIYITVFLLDYSIEEAVNKIKRTGDKKNYSSKFLKTSKLGL